MKRRILSILGCLLLGVSAVSPDAWAQYSPGGLFSLARSGDIEGLKKLLEKKPNQFLLDNALEAAMIGQQPEAVTLLHEHGANLNYINPDGTALLVNAIMLDSPQIAQHLLELGADPDIIGYHRLYYGYTMDWKWTPLMAASFQGDLATASFLLEKGADVNAFGYSVSVEDKETAADIAAYSGQMEILDLLLKNGGKLDNNAIFKAARGGHLQVVRFLLKQGYDVNGIIGPRQKTLLMEAAWWGHLPLVEFLIQEGADINAADVNGFTALSDAAENGGAEFPHQLDIVKLLVENGADVRQAGDFKLTPLMRAQNPDVIKFLIEAGAE